MSFSKRTAPGRMPGNAFGKTPEKFCNIPGVQFARVGTRGG
ncbi:MAG: hypothetical protein U1F05_13680 [Burkholderiales bacterium]